MIDVVPTNYKSSPVLLDLAIDNIRRGLLEKLPWLDNAFGRVHKTMRYVHDSKFVEPSFYIGNGEYVSMIPNDHWGNFCWFDIYDPQNIEFRGGAGSKIKFRGAVVFWYNQSTIFDDDTFLYNEEIKKQVVEALSSAGLMKQNGHIELFDIYERLENIYKGYSLEKVYNSYLYSGEEIEFIDKQYFMHPYGGLRVEFELTLNNNVC